MYITNIYSTSFCSNSNMCSVNIYIYICILQIYSTSFCPNSKTYLYFIYYIGDVIIPYVLG